MAADAEAARAAAPSWRALQRAFVFTYSAFPWSVFPLMATKPTMCSAFRACIMQSSQNSTLRNCCLPRALAFLLTALPRLFSMRSSLLKPPDVLSRVPFNTMDLAKRPRATFVVFLALLIARRCLVLLGGKAIACGGGEQPRWLQNLTPVKARRLE